MNKERVLALLRGDGFTVFAYFLSLIIASALLPVLGTKIALVQEGLLALLMVLLFCFIETHYGLNYQVN